ncbi:UxaA family hydrolase [Paenibacillus planticolens]|uniref:D-galactarate dehydratase n=1 Tax=Paenibacillus planticolens TaxID=2654976 RepID=A0ABX1ZX66_9BACL|nr:UxaA family hydrolase [Paenibacillus planticolens]NOV04630.1 D-galactarate dehydratase [Paenibacillus planticolens]
MAHDFSQGTDSLVMNEKDDVATVLRDVSRGESIHFLKDTDLQTLPLKDSVPFGHKVAIRLIKQGTEVYKYGEIIGRATRDIQAGEHVHVHNIEGTRGRGDMARADVS